MSRWPALPHLARWMPVVLLAVAGCNARHRGASVEPPAGPLADAPVTVRVRPVQRRSLVQTISALGTCEALPDRIGLITPPIEGQVREILVQQGEAVARGTPVVQLDTTLAEADLAEKKAACETLEASLKLLQSVPRSEEQEASKLAIEQAKIAVSTATAVLDRLRPLGERGEVSQQQLFDAEQTLKQARMQQRTAAAQYAVLMLGPRDEAIVEAQARIRAAAEAVRLAHTRLELHTLRAPIDGTLDSLTCLTGETLTVGTSVGQVVDSHRVFAAAWLPVERGRQVRKGQSVRVWPAAPEGSASTTQPGMDAMPGKIISVGKMTDMQTGNMPVRAVLDNPDGQLVIGQTLELAIVVDQPPESLVVPEAAIHDEGEGPSMTVIRDGKAVVLQPELGISAGGLVAVSGVDLRAGEPVVVQGAYNLPDGTEVATLPAKTAELAEPIQSERSATPPGHGEAKP